MVFLTAAHPKFKCGVCKHLDSELQFLAKSYAAESKKNKVEQKIFFVRLDYESAQKMFQNYEITSVPVIFHIDSHSSSEKSGKEYSINHRDKFQIPQDPTAESMASFLSERTGVSVPLKRSMIMAYVVLVILFGIIALLVQPVINSLPFWLRIIQSKSIWLVVSAGLYTCAISGLIFDIIRAPPMYEFSS